MFFIFGVIITLMILAAIGAMVFRATKIRIVPEDTVAVTVDRDGFIKRVLPAGRHALHPFEEIDFAVEIKPRLTGDQISGLATAEGLPITINWSGVYRLAPDLITEQVSQRLRGLPTAARPVARNVEIGLRGLVGHYSVRDLFKPAIRERIERQVNRLVADKVKGLGIVLTGFNLQAIELPAEVAEALNQANAITTLDGAIRQLDPATREIVRGVYQLDEVLHWDAYLPLPSRRTMKRLEKVVG